MPMAIQRWHWGKLVIVWAWGGMIAAVLLTSFVARDAGIAPVWSAFSLIAGLTILAALTAVTWRWLGGKEK